jgi:hypothetical protein
VYLNLRITYKNETTRDIKAQWDNFIAFEDQFDIPFTTVLDPKKSRLKHVTWLCWHVETLDKKTDKSFDDWCKEISTCGFVPENEVGEPIPLEIKARTGA